MYAGMIDKPTVLQVAVDDADEQICESRVETLGSKLWGFRKIAWIGGAFVIGTVVGALVFDLSSAAKSPVPRSPFPVNQLQEVDAEESLGHLPRRQEDFRNIICPFLSTLVHEGALPVKDSYTVGELRNVTMFAGLPADLLDPHLAGNFQNNPSGTQDLFSMEGASNEHVTSTGVHDCPTMYFNCFKTDGVSFNNIMFEDVQVIGDQTWSCTNRTLSCELPNEDRFDTFFSEVDANQDGIMTRTELSDATFGGMVGPAPSPDSSFQTQDVSFVDANPIALGDVRGSHMFIIDIFGEPCADGHPCDERGFPDTISKERLRTVFIDRQFPEDYVFGIPAPTTTGGDAGVEPDKDLEEVAQAVKDNTEAISQIQAEMAEKARD